MSIRRALRDRYKNVPDNGGFGEISWMSNESHERTVQSRPGTGTNTEYSSIYILSFHTFISLINSVIFGIHKALQKKWIRQPFPVAGKEQNL